MIDDELKNIYGGSGISGTILNAIARLADLLLEVGRSLGTSLRRRISHTTCS